MTKQKSKSVKAGVWVPIEGGVTAPAGFQAAGIAAGIKKAGSDLMVLFSTEPATTAAGVFTQNRVQAAPVQVSREHLKLSRGRAQAILINSGCANACTGERGRKDTLTSAQKLAARLGIEDTKRVLVASTGVIGEFLPMPKLLNGITAAVSALAADGGLAAARAIMTTDTCEKTCAFASRVGDKTVRVGGMAKGSGMIHPNMATMLGVITTDIKIAPGELQRMLRRVTERTFNCLTVDGDTSTNDTVFVLASGASGAVADDSDSLQALEKGLTAVCEYLAQSIARDGEGATKFVTITVKGAPDFNAARTVAKSIAHSPLVKTALYGQELNWGRILCAVGYSKVPFDPDKALLRLNGIVIFRHGAPVPATRTKAEAAIKEHDLLIEVELGQGSAEATVWTCDLSHEYVNINASYIS